MDEGAYENTECDPRLGLRALRNVIGLQEHIRDFAEVKLREAVAEDLRRWVENHPACATPVLVTKEAAGFTDEIDEEFARVHLKAPKELILGKRVKLPETHNVVATVKTDEEASPFKLMQHWPHTELKYSKFKALILRILETNATFLLSENGSVVCCGTFCVDAARWSMHILRLMLKSLGLEPGFYQISIDNRVVVGSIGHKIRLEGILYEDSIGCVFNPKTFPGLIYIMWKPRVVLVIFATGRFTGLGVQHESEIMLVFEHIMPILDRHKCSDEEAASATAKTSRRFGSNRSKRKATPLTQQEKEEEAEEKRKQLVMTKGRRKIYSVLADVNDPAEARARVHELLDRLNREIQNEDQPLAADAPPKKKRGRKPKSLLAQQAADPNNKPPEPRKLRIEHPIVSDFEAFSMPALYAEPHTVQRVSTGLEDEEDLVVHDEADADGAVEEKEVQAVDIDQIIDALCNAELQDGEDPEAPVVEDDSTLRMLRDLGIS
jgi:transcription initiation factor TFIID TATA-box-binding protein